MSTPQFDVTDNFVLLVSTAGIDIKKKSTFNPCNVRAAPPEGPLPAAQLSKKEAITGIAALILLVAFVWFMFFSQR